ncbi:conserved hypothetical protein [Leptospira interrogans serovar Copenhageni str. Fiocruz L1-130]|uniref:Uncharacterized protein n=4 Tax=Leptospira interrogans TaxID=173 RepID=Q72RP4_LEPIC|nr:conserved hypothetical protein [Leptospira interrogans serovar Copenhageni str. Fiocruz L1-130]
MFYLSELRRFPMKNVSPALEIFGWGLGGGKKIGQVSLYYKILIFSRRIFKAYFVGTTTIPFLGSA